MLIWSGIEAARKVDDDMDVEDTLLVRSLRYMCGNRIRKDYDLEERRLVSWDEQGRLQITMLLVVIICLEVTDVLFAIDSVSAKVAQVPNQYLAFSSSVIAMFGLRAMFFVVRDLVHMFELLSYGLCIILVFIGVELVLSHWLELQSATVCVVILAIFGVCMLASVAQNRIEDRQTQSNQSVGCADDNKMPNGEQTN